MKDFFSLFSVIFPVPPEYEFPTSLTSDERCYVHRLALELGLKSKSRGKGAGRYLTVYKREGSTIMQSDAILALSPPARKFSINLLNQYPVTSKERQELLPPTDRERNPYVTSESTCPTNITSVNLVLGCSKVFFFTILTPALAFLTHVSDMKTLEQPKF